MGKVVVADWDQSEKSCAVPPAMRQIAPISELPTLSASDGNLFGMPLTPQYLSHMPPLAYSFSFEYSPHQYTRGVCMLRVALASRGVWHGRGFTSWHYAAPVHLHKKSSKALSVFEYLSTTILMCSMSDSPPPCLLAQTHGARSSARGTY